MTSRRSRIKGIANIPQRRKAATEDNDVTVKKSVESESNNSSNNTDISASTEIEKNEIPKEILPDKPPITTIPEIVKESNDKLELEAKNEIVKPTKPSIRTFKKFPVSLNAIQRRKPDIINTNSQISENTEVEKTQNEEKESEDNIKNDKLISENTENTFQKPIPVNLNTSYSDTEYPLPPPSPNKANRSRIKAIPRLAQRKTSFSASESEDESRKINRIRNDSVCSTTSAATEIAMDCFSPQRPKDPSVTAVPKKIVRTEQTRKLAEARREFNRRFGASKPERHRLTMMDLIFYNPDSNPMTEDKVNEKEPETEEIKDPDDPETQEIQDKEEDKNEEGEEEEEENAMPVPQIKIGPSGEIILDEQSLLIERKDVKRQREELQKTKIVDADKFKTSYGVYKKHQRSKYWSHAETLRFYKALNTIGTDFMLMCELFPNRARRELKIKFKKEEKMNRHLIDRALMQPCSFDFEDLKNEIELEERELEELQRQKDEEKKQREQKMKENNQKVMESIERAKKRKASEIKNVKQTKLDECGNSEADKKKVAEIIHKIKSKKAKVEKLSIKNYMSNSDADESDLATQSESDDEVILSRKPTRSGRMPKSIQRYDEELTTTVNTVLKRNNKVEEESQPNNIEPGSIMIINETGENGEPVYKIYMVTPEQKATRLDLSSDVITKAIQLKEGVTAENLMTISANVTDDEEEMPLQENNVTIPADETIKTLKSKINIISSQVIVNSHETSENSKQQQTNKIDDDINNKTNLISSEDGNQTILNNNENNVINSPINNNEDKQNQSTDYDSDDVILNDFSENEPIILEVKSDGSCSKLNTEKNPIENKENISGD